ncbi:MAG: ribonuclease III domain-containing protein [Cyanobacteriota bacterium]|nr:ribonuclease III domain-containing protein [Cyanobacteriota bacterium]
MDALPTLAAEAELNVLQLAWLGDAVWELHQRLRHCQAPGRPNDLHNLVVARVRAEAQAKALERLRPHLRPGEESLVRRGRNRAGRGSRHQDGSLHGQATGFETMVGWLFLRDPRRLAELLDHLEDPDPTATPTDHGPIRE